MEFDREKMKQRFHELTAKATAIRAKADPIREKRDALQKRKGSIKQIEKLNADLRRAEKGLFEIEQERAMIARAVGNVGEPATES